MARRLLLSRAMEAARELTLVDQIEDDLWSACIHVDAGAPDERTLEAFASVPREQFVTPEARRFAHRSIRLPIGLGHWTPSPSLLALATSLLRLDGYERILEIGCGSGYHTAVLARLTGAVVAVDRLEEMVDRTEVNLGLLGIENVRVVAGNGYRGVERLAPYDVVVVGASVSTIPVALMSQLAQGGRIVAPIGDRMRVLDATGNAFSSFWIPEPISPLVAP